ncbi:MAG: ACP S-malonyltransferase [Desulfosalsimonas sp.]
METANNRVEIFAFCAEQMSGLKAAIRSAGRDLAKGIDISVLGEKTRSEFDSDSCFRLLAVAPNSGEIPGLLDNASDRLENLPLENQSLAPGLFFGKNPPDGKLAFVFPGQGSQYPFMGFCLENAFEEAATVINAAEKAFSRKPSLMSYLYPQGKIPAKPAGAEAGALQKTDVAQPAIGTISLMMLKILQKHGLLADAACGHSFGELTALCAAERISEKDFMELAVKRGRLMAAAGKKSEDSGGMLAVRASAKAIEDLIEKHGADVVLANRNSPNQGVISGPLNEIEKMQKICRENRIVSARLPVSAAFHSRLVMDAAEPFKEIVSKTPFLPGRIPVYSNTTAGPYPENPDSARALLGSHLTQPVNFIDEITNMHKAGVSTFLEVGPKAVLTGLIKQILSDQPHAAFSVDSSAGKQPALFDLAAALCRTAALGYVVELEKWPGAIL